MTDIGNLITEINQCLVPRFKDGSERPCDETDFQEFIPKNIHRLKKINHLLDNAPQPVDKNLLTVVFQLLGENHQQFPWNNREVCELCDGVRVKLLSEESGILPLVKPVLLALRPKLLKDTWKEFPAAVQCFVWILGNLKQSYVADNVQHILPMGLLLVDDFVNENRVLGIKCLNLVIHDLGLYVSMTNPNPHIQTVAELKYHGYGELVYKALQGLLRERDVAVADAVIPCILSLISKLETDYGDVVPSFKWSRFDDTMEILLEIMEIENQIAMRGVYVSYMLLVLQTIGTRVHRWSKRILSIFDHYLEVAGSAGDCDTATQVLKAMVLFLELTKSVTKWYRPHALFILFRLFYHFDEQTDELNTTRLHCLRLVLAESTPDEINIILDEAKIEIDSHPVYQKIIQVCQQSNHV